MATRLGKSVLGVLALLAGVGVYLVTSLVYETFPSIIFAGDDPPVARGLAFLSLILLAVGVCLLGENWWSEGRLRRRRPRR